MLVLFIWIVGMLLTYAWLKRFQSEQFYGTGWYLDPSNRLQRRWRRFEAIVWPLALFAYALGRVL